MRRYLRALVGVAGALPLVLTPAAAHADGSAAPRIGFQAATGLECTVYPYLTYPPSYSTYCSSPRPSYSSTIHFRVQSPSPTATYSWSTSGAPLPSSCTATSTSCSVAVNNTRVDRGVTATVTVYDGGQARQFTSQGWAFAACPGPTGTEFC